MTRLISWNVNGIRAVSRSGFLEWMERESPDILCLQEIKAVKEQLTPELVNPIGFHSYWHSAEKLGYSGVSVYSKQEPLDVHIGIGTPEIDREGRVMTLRYKDFTLINTYFPNSQRDHARLGYKLEFCHKIFEYSQKLRTAGQNVLICGDYNIAHREIDLKNPQANRNNAGFLPEERAWMDSFIHNGYIDTFRKFNSDPGHYTWWSYRPGVRQKNIGWRLDYFFANQEFQDRLKSAAIFPQVLGSDHCPVDVVIKD